MTRSASSTNWKQYEAVLFDMDGVLTDTASVHATCWKRMFDAFLQRWQEKTGTPLRPFDIDKDYRLYVDGKPRYDGVRSFLDARGITLPDGEPQEEPGWETVCGLGNQKNALIHEVLQSDGVKTFPGSLRFLHFVRRIGLRTAVVSSSKNCRAILAAAGIEDLFEACVDGEVAARLGLPGKPAPDTFLAAGERLGVAPEKAVVIEDAISGVQAGRAGGFALVVGVDRNEDGAGLARYADLLVADLEALLPSESNPR